MSSKGLAWQPETEYVKGDYVYPSTVNGYYYKCLSDTGTSTSNTKNNSKTTEPTWVLNKWVYDNKLVWKSVPVVGSELSWSPNTEYTIGDIILPTTGPVIVNSTNYGFKLRKIQSEPDWPVKEEQAVLDNDLIWETHVSSSRFLPKQIRTQKLYVQAINLIDWILEQESPNINDVLFKYKDRYKVSIDALLLYTKEQGYEYITDVLELDQTRLTAIVDYLNLIHLLKGHRQGLELILDLLDIEYKITEWWEEQPKEVPDSFKLELELSVSSASSNGLFKLVEFVRHYVYPKLKHFLITYNDIIAELRLSHAGFCDGEYNIEVVKSIVMYTGGFGVTDCVYSGYTDHVIECALLTTEDGKVITTESGIPLHVCIGTAPTVYLLTTEDGKVITREDGTPLAVNL